MTKFEMIKYHSQQYPDDVPLRTEEIAAHFDVAKVDGVLAYSLHTEYSYDNRRFDEEIVNRFPALVAAQKNGVPQLWKNTEWALQFAQYLVALVDGKTQPRIIEIHPPFDDYTDMDKFIEVYTVFENEIKKAFPEVEVLIENRCGSRYRGGKFILSKMKDMYVLGERIKQDNLKLKIAYDIPQVYTAHNVKNKEDYIRLLKEAKEIRSHIGGIHLWGKRKSKSGRIVSHVGDLNSYFEDENIKEEFLQTFKECFDDGVVRKMVLEVNSGNEDLKSIVKDLKKTGIEFE